MFGGVHFSPGRPDPDNVARLDHNALPLIHWMEAEGIRVDIPFLQSLDAEVLTRQSEVDSQIRSTIGNAYQDFDGKKYQSLNIGSPDQIARLLFQHLQIQGGATLEMTKKGTREIVDDDVLAQFDKSHPVIPLIREYRMLDKLHGTYTLPLQLLADSNSRIHTSFNVTVAATGRLSSSEPNLQNIPVRTEIGKRVRDAFCASTGCYLVSADLSQIEMRWAAHRSQDPTMMGVFFRDEDVHSRTACNIYGLIYSVIMDLAARVDAGTATEAEVKEYKYFKNFQRLPCKNVGFGVLYGQTAEGLQVKLAADGVFWTLEECEDFITNKFFAVYEKMREMLEADYAFAMRYGMICDDFGRGRLVPEAKSYHKWLKSEGVRKAGNHPEQCVNKHTQVFVKGLGMVHIGSLVGKRVTLWDGVRWSTGGVVETGKKKQLRIQLYNGQDLYCSPDHKLLTRDTDGREKWYPAGDLIKVSQAVRRNTRVVLPDEVDREWNWNKYPPMCPPTKDTRSNEVDLTWADDKPELFGEMLGRIASDGGIMCSTKSRQFSPKVTYILVAEHEKCILPRLQEAAYMCCDSNRVTTHIKQGLTTTGEPYAPLYRLEIYSRGLAELLLDWEIKDRIPSYLWNNSRILRAYLRGMFDGDGCVTDQNAMLTFGGGMRKIALAKDVQQALLLFGIRSRLRCYQKAIRLSVQKIDCDLFMELVGFMNPVKVKKMKMMLPTTRSMNPVYGRAVSIKEVIAMNDVEMVDFCNSTTGRFMANGMVVHNSSAQGTIKLAMAELFDIMKDINRTHRCVPLLQIHDELISDVDRRVAREFGEAKKAVFEQASPISVPVKSSMDVAERWGELK